MSDGTVPAASGEARHDGAPRVPPVEYLTPEYAEVMTPPDSALDGIDERLDDKSVLLRSSNILRAFEDGDSVLSLVEIVRRCSLPKSTVHRICEQMVVLGWLERGPFGYQVGIRLFEIGGLADRYRTLRERTRPRLYELARSTGLSVQLAVLDATEIVYLNRIPARDFELPTRDGGRAPAYCTALGKALAAFGREADVQKIAAADKPQRTAFTFTDSEALIRELGRARNAGFALDRQEWSLGVSCVAAPVKGPGHAVAAVSLTGEPGRVDPDEHGRLLAGVGAMMWDDVFRPHS